MARSRRDDDDDDDDYRPKKTGRSPRDDEDENEDDDRPVGKKKLAGVNRSRLKASSGGPLQLVLLLLGGGVVLLAGGGLAVWLLFFNENPRTAFNDFQSAWTAKDYGRVYDRYDADTKKLMDNLTALVKLDPKHRDKSGRELFITMYEEFDKNPKNQGRSGGEVWRQQSTVESVKEEGNSATLTVKDANGGTQTVRMKKENGKWKVNATPGR